MSHDECTTLIPAVQPRRLVRAGARFFHTLCLFLGWRLGLRRPRRLRDLYRLGDLEGWEPGRPLGTLWVEGFKIDKEVAEGSDCPVCGRKGQRYLPFRRRAEGGVREWGYRAFTECPRCGHVEEF